MIVDALKFALKRAAAFLLMGWYVLSFGLLVYIFGPRIDQMFPVVSDWAVVDKTITSDGSLVFRYTFSKHRNCDLSAYNWLYNNQGVVGMANISRAPGTGPHTLPTGHNISAWWRLDSAEPDGNYFVSLIYNCHLPWYTEASMGPFELRRDAK